MGSGAEVEVAACVLDSAGKAGEAVAGREGWGCAVIDDFDPVGVEGYPAVVCGGVSYDVGDGFADDPAEEGGVVTCNLGMLGAGEMGGDSRCC